MAMAFTSGRAYCYRAPGHHVFAEKQRHLHLDPESANGYSIVAGVVIAILVVGVQVMGWMNLFDSVPLLIVSALVSA